MKTMLDETPETRKPLPKSVQAELATLAEKSDGTLTILASLQQPTEIGSTLCAASSIALTRSINTKRTDAAYERYPPTVPSLLRICTLRTQTPS